MPGKGTRRNGRAFEDIVAGRRARYRQAGETRWKPAAAAFPRGLPQQLAQLAGLRLDGLARPGPQFLEVAQAGVMDAAGYGGRQDGRPVMSGRD